MNLIENLKKIKSFLIEYYWIAFIPVVMYAFIQIIFEREDINQNLNETYGIVYNSTPIYQKYNKNKHNYRYEFIHKGKKYTGSSSAHISDKIRIGNTYKVEFSNLNPEHSRMIFDSVYVRKFKTNKNGKVTDTIYVLKGQELRNEMKDLIEKYEIKTDNKKDEILVEDTISTKYNVALNFINDYVDNCNKMKNQIGIIEWINSNQNASKELKSELIRIIEEANQNDPEYGLGFDPIFDAQDYPDEGFELTKFDSISNYLTVEAKNWKGFIITMKIKEINNKWLVDGCGIINIPKTMQAER